MIENFNRTVITIVDYDRKTFTVQASEHFSFTWNDGNKMKEVNCNF